MSTEAAGADAEVRSPEPDWKALGGVGSFFEFVDRLAEVPGVKIGPDKVVRLATVFGSLRRAGKRLHSGSAAARIIVPLVAVTSEGHTAAGKAVRTWWNQAHGIVATGVDDERTGSDRRVTPEFRRRLIALGAVAVILLAVVLAGIAIYGWGGQTTVQVDVPPRVADTPTGSLVLYDWLMALVAEEILPRVLLVVGVVGITVVWWVYSRRYRPEGLVRREAEGRIASRLTPPALLEQNQRADLRQAGRYLRRPVEVASDEIDVRRSLAQTINTGGFPAILRRMVKRTPDCLFIVDSVSRGDHLSALADELARRLSRGGVDLVRYDFRRQLDVMEAVDRRFNGRPMIRLRELAERHPHARVVVVGTGEAFFRPNSNALRDDLAGLVGREGGPARLFPDFEHNPMLVTPTPRTRWGPREAALSDAGVGVVAFDALEAGDTGILQLTTSVAEERPMPSIRQWTRAFDDPVLRELDRDRLTLISNIPPPEAVAARLARLVHSFVSERLPDDKDLEPPSEADLSFSLDPIADDPARARAARGLAALAIFPLLDPVWTPHVWAKVTGKPLDPMRLARLARLPWFRIGRMPDWLRAALVNFIKDTAARRMVADRLSDFVADSLSGTPDSRTVAVNRPRRGRFLLTLSLSPPEERRVFEESLFFDFIERPDEELTTAIVPPPDANRPTLTQRIGLGIGAAAAFFVLIYGRWLYDAVVAIVRTVPGSDTGSGNALLGYTFAVAAPALVGLGLYGEHRSSVRRFQAPLPKWFAVWSAAGSAMTAFALAAVFAPAVGSEPSGMMLWMAIILTGVLALTLLLVSAKDRAQIPSGASPPQFHRHIFVAGLPIALLAFVAAVTSSEWVLFQYAFIAFAIWLLSARWSLSPETAGNSFQTFVSSSIALPIGGIYLFGIVASFWPSLNVLSVAIIGASICLSLYVGATTLAHGDVDRDGAIPAISAGFCIGATFPLYFLLIYTDLFYWVLASFGSILAIGGPVFLGIFLLSAIIDFVGFRPVKIESPDMDSTSYRMPGRWSLLSILAAPLMAERARTSLRRGTVFRLVYSALIGLVFVLPAIGTAAVPFYSSLEGFALETSFLNRIPIAILLGAIGVALIAGQFFVTTLVADKYHLWLQRERITWRAIAASPWWATIAMWLVVLAAAIHENLLGSVHTQVGSTPILAFLVIPIAIYYTARRDGESPTIPILAGLIPFLLATLLGDYRTPGGLWMIPAALLLVRTANHAAPLDGRRLAIRGLDRFDRFGPAAQPILLWLAATVLILVVSIRLDLPLGSLGNLLVEPMPIILALLFILGWWLNPWSLVLSALVALGAYYLAGLLLPATVTIDLLNVGISEPDLVAAALMPGLGRATLLALRPPPARASLRTYVAFFGSLLVLALAPLAPSSRYVFVDTSQPILWLSIFGPSAIMAAGLAFGLSGARVLRPLSFPRLSMMLQLAAVAGGVVLLIFPFVDLIDLAWTQVFGNFASLEALRGSSFPIWLTYLPDLAVFLGLAAIAHVAQPVAVPVDRAAEARKAAAAAAEMEYRDNLDDYDEAGRSSATKQAPAAHDDAKIQSESPEAPDVKPSRRPKRKTAGHEPDSSSSGPDMA